MYSAIVKGGFYLSSGRRLRVIRQNDFRTIIINNIRSFRLVKY